MENNIFINHKNNPDKTWSSVSNSSLSKTFALCQFRKLKLQKLCFLPPNIVLGLKKKINPKILLGQKKILVQKKFGLEKIWVGKNFGSEKMLDPKKIFGTNKNFLAWKKILGPKKIFGLKKFEVKKKFWVPKKFCVKKNFRSDKNLCLEKIWVWKNFGSKKFCCCSCSSCDLDP